MTITQNSVKNHYYLHEVFNRTWAVLSHLYGEEDLKQMGFKQDFDWSQPPSKKFKKVKVPHLVASSYSSSCETDEHEVWTTLRHALLQQPTPTMLTLLHRLREEILQGR